MSSEQSSDIDSPFIHCFGESSDEQTEIKKTSEKSGPNLENPIILSNKSIRIEIIPTISEEKISLSKKYMFPLEKITVNETPPFKSWIFSSLNEISKEKPHYSVNYVNNIELGIANDWAVIVSGPKICTVPSALSSEPPVNSTTIFIPSGITPSFKSTIPQTVQTKPKTLSRDPSFTTKPALTRVSPRKRTKTDTIYDTM